MNNTSNVTGLFAIAAAVILFAVIGFMQSNKWLKQQANDTCMKTSFVEYDYPDKNIKSTTWDKDVFQKCLKEMGY